MSRPIIGVSSCLMGEPVRFNGGHKRHSWIINHLGKHVDFKMFCPEVGIGLPTPRPTLRIIATENGNRAVDSDTQNEDYTDALAQYYHQIAPQTEDLDGYLLMQGSPSCGMERVKLYNSHMIPEKSAAGIFAAELMAHQPHLPIEEGGRIGDAALAESFLSRLFVHHEWRTERPYLSAKGLVDFHSRHKYLIMLHDYEGYRRLGPMLSDLSDKNQLPAIGQAYFEQLMASLRNIPKRGHRANALMHLYGYVKDFLTDDEKQSVLNLIEQYRLQNLPYVVPLTMIRHYAHVNREHAEYISQQSVWSPYPDTLNQFKGH